MISEELPYVSSFDGIGEDVAEALLTSGREVVIGVAWLDADIASLPLTRDPRWRTSMSNSTYPSSAIADGGEEQAKEERVARLVDELADEYGEVAEPSLVDAEVRSEFARLSRESRVDDFVPMLTERVVRARLNDRFRCHTRRRAGTSANRIADLQGSKG